MRTLFKLLVCVCAAHALAAVAQAKEWRGIVPLRSTRADVARLHGPCADPKLRCEFNSENWRVYVVFSSGDDYVDCARLLPPGTVLHIQVTPLTEVKWPTPGVDLSRFRKFESSLPPGIGSEAYFDDEEGVIYDTFEGRLVQIEYLAEKKDVPLCPAYYDKPELFVSKIVDPPSLDVECPARVEAGGRATLTVSISGAPHTMEPTYDWRVSAGKIVSGQGTSAIVIEAPGAEAGAVQVAVEVGGSIFELAGSCEIRVTGKGDDKAKPAPDTP